MDVEGHASLNRLAFNATATKLIKIAVLAAQS